MPIFEGFCFAGDRAEGGEAERSVGLHSRQISPGPSVLSRHGCLVTQPCGFWILQAEQAKLPSRWPLTRFGRLHDQKIPPDPRSAGASTLLACQVMNYHLGLLLVP